MAKKLLIKSYKSAFWKRKVLSLFLTFNKGLHKNVSWLTFNLLLPE